MIQSIQMIHPEEDTPHEPQKRQKRGTRGRGRKSRFLYLRYKDGTVMSQIATGGELPGGVESVKPRDDRNEADLVAGGLMAEGEGLQPDQYGRRVAPNRRQRRAGGARC